MFSRMIYALAAIDAVLLSVFFYKLSRLSEEALGASPHIEFSLWVDYPVLIVLAVLLPSYLHYSRQKFRVESERVFRIGYELHSKIVTILFCDLVPFIILVTMLIRSAMWLAFNSGPGA